MAADTAKFIVEFQADVKSLRKTISELKKDVGDFNKGDKRLKKEQTQYAAQDKRRMTVERREKKRDQDMERRHVRIVSRDKVTADRTASKERIRAMETEVRTYQRLAKKGPLPAHMDPDGRYSGRQSQKQGGALGRGYSWAKAAAFGVGALGVGLLKGAAESGYQNYMEMRVARGRSIGLGAAGMGNRDVVAGLRGARGGRLGYSSIDTANMMPTMARATGSMNVKELMQGTRVTGMEAGEVGSIFGGIRQAGHDFKDQGKAGSAGMNQLKKIMSAASQSGLENARKGELIEGVMSIAKQQQGVVTGKIDLSSIASALALWGKTGQPGMQSTAGANLYGQVTNSIKNPGGGAWGDAFMNQAMGFGVPGGKTNYHDAKWMREEAATNPDIIKKVMDYARKTLKSPNEQDFGISEVMNVSMHQARALQGVYSPDKNATEQRAGIEKIMEEAQPLEKQSLDEMKKLGGGVQRVAELMERSIGVGEKFAPMIDELENLQYKVLQEILKVLQEIEKDLKELRDFFLKNQTNAGKASGSLDAAQTMRDQARGSKTSTDAVSRYKQEFLALKQARDQAGATVGFNRASALELVTGAITGDDKKNIRQQVAMEQEATRKGLAAGGRYARAKKIQDTYGDVELTPEMKKYIDAGGDAAVQAGNFDDMNVPAPPEMKRKKRTNSGVVAPTAAPAPAANGASVGTSGATASSTTQKVDVTVKHVTTRASDAPTMAVQTAGSPATPATRDH